MSNKVLIVENGISNSTSHKKSNNNNNNNNKKRWAKT